MIANVSSLAFDIPHTANTLGYAAPLRVAVLESEAADTWEVDALDPANWTHETLHSWVSNFRLCVKSARRSSNPTVLAKTLEWFLYASFLAYTVLIWLLDQWCCRHTFSRLRPSVQSLQCHPLCLMQSALAQWRG